MTASTPKDGATVRQGQLSERVYRQLKEDILAGRVGRGDLLLEQALAARYEVSKTPVREALRLLVHDGLLLVLPRKGYMVRPVGLQDVAEVFEMRRIIEPSLCAEAARRRTPEQIIRMRESIALERDMEDPSLDEMEQSVHLHRLVAEASGNTRGMAIVGSLMDEASRLPWVVFPVLRPGPGRPGVEEHVWIVDAIEAGDAETASRIMSEHLDATIARTVGGLGVR
jgi:DNA-binding GntR family transcriptional regulator